MTGEPTLEEQLAALTDEQRVELEARAERLVAAEKALAHAKALDAAEKAAESSAEVAELRDERQDGKLTDPRDLGPVGG